MGALMVREALCAPEVVAAQQGLADERLAALACRLRERPPALVVTVGRGSSDHAASYLAYLVMQRLGIPVLSLPMSLLTLHTAPLAVAGQLAIVISQSGESPDLLRTVEALDAAGAVCVALVNRLDSPLARACAHVVPLDAGEERSVAATKSYVAALAASARLVAHWQGDARLLAALRALPEQLKAAGRHDWAPLVRVFSGAQRAMVVGRGLGFAVALEAALKLKETCAIQAEAFSAAELRHGPLALIEGGYPLLVLALRGPEQPGLLALAADLRARGARVVVAAPPDVAERDVTLEPTGDMATDPLTGIQSFYLAAARIALARGLNPDAPRHLSKVTLTL
jgi:glucosamine--fructose-6-phosphate aminotransferase (isomerizing)